MHSPFPAALRGIPNAVFPRSRESPGSSSRGLTPPSEYCLLRSCSPPASAEHLPWGSRLHRDVSAGVHQSAVFPSLPLFRPQRFSRSRRLTPPCTFAGLFHPTATSEILSSGAFPSSQPTQLVAVPCPLDVGRNHLRTVADPLQIRLPRLQGFDPTTDSFSSTSGLGSPTPDPLLSFHSRGFFSEHLGDAFAPPPLMTFAVDSSGDADSGLQRINSVRPSFLSPELLPVRALRPFI